jgi:hypothetical protein
VTRRTLWPRLETPARPRLRGEGGRGRSQPSLRGHDPRPVAAAFPGVQEIAHSRLRRGEDVAARWMRVAERVAGVPWVFDTRAPPVGGDAENGPWAHTPITRGITTQTGCGAFRGVAGRPSLRLKRRRGRRVGPPPTRASGARRLYTQNFLTAS